MPCSDHAVLLKATAQHGRRETACGLPARVRLLPAITRSSTKIVISSISIILTTIHTYDFSGSSTLQKDDLLNCWTSSSDISGYHADLYEGHGTVGAGQRSGMGAAWALHAMCESPLRTRLLLLLQQQLVSDVKLLRCNMKQEQT
jgi:hypothetical protein